jgi:thioesterase domain-containing protein
LRLGRANVLEAGARPAEVTSAIEKFIASVDAVTNEVSAAPLVFFFPPLEGDMPHIARFRAMFDCKFRFAMVHYPTSREIRAGFDSMEAFARFAVAQIQTSRESGPLIFFGCSSGGFVAWEAARSLVESGDGVAFFGLIDSRLHPEPFAAGEMENDPLRLTHRLRRDVLARFEPAPLDIQATLFRTDPLGEGGLWLGPADYGWGAVCQELTISNVEGSHATIFELSNARSLRQRMIEAVEAVVH